MSTTIDRFIAARDDIRRTPADGGSSRAWGVLALLAATGALLCLSLSSASAGITTLVSVSSAEIQGGDDSIEAHVSADGRYAVFESAAANLVAGDTNGVSDIFVRDTETGETTRVSVDTGGTQANFGSYLPAISADGRYIAFESDATNLVSGDTNLATDIFVHDRDTGATTRASVATGGTQGNLDSFFAVISADGRYVAFESDATNLVVGDVNGVSDVFRRDLQAPGATIRVSVASDGSQANEGSYDAAISADGRYVAFDSDDEDLVPGDVNLSADVFVRDCTGGTTVCVSVATGGAKGNDHSIYPTISADGLIVAFDSEATNLVSGDSNEAADVFVHDLDAGVTTRASVDADGGDADGESIASSISADGRFVAFESLATDLVAGDANGVSDIFVRDRQFGATVRASVADGGGDSNGASFAPSISADGANVVFDSLASNLVSVDTNGAYDVFLHSSWSFTLTLNGSNGEVLVDGIPHSVPWAGLFDSGAEVDLEAVSDDCWVFDGWSGDLSGMENPTAIVMDGDKEITAEFASSYIFDDVACDSWAAPSIAACYYAGVVAGYDDGLYHGDLPVDRAAMAVYIARALVAPSGEAGLADYTPADPQNFPDVPDTGHGYDGTDPYWAYTHIEYCVEHGVVQGYEYPDPDTPGETIYLYEPLWIVTRDQMAVYVARALVVPSGEAGLADYVPADPRNFPDVPDTGYGVDGTDPYWAYMHVEYCVEHGVVQGYEYPDPDTPGEIIYLYEPLWPVTRDQMAVYVQRAFDLPL